MTDQNEDDPMRWLPAKALSSIDAARAALERCLGDTLESVFIVGAALNPARGDRGQAPELIAIVRADYLSKMATLAEALSGPMKSGVRVRLVTSEELERAADVFALEMAEWKARHRLLHGSDVLAKVTVNPEHLRHSLELELRGLSRRIRNRVLAGIAAGPTRDDPARAVRDGVDRLLVAAHHLLVLADGSAPAEEPALVAALASKLAVDGERFAAVRAAVREGKRPPAPLDALAAVMELSDAASRWIDRWEVRR
jgi:hypothetical protein